MADTTGFWFRDLTSWVLRAYIPAMGQTPASRPEVWGATSAFEKGQPAVLLGSAFNICIYTYTYIHIHTYVHAYIHTYIHTLIHASMHACAHTYIYIYTYM